MKFMAMGRELMANANLSAAKAAKNDEFYTCREDIEAELTHYADLFRGKTVYCNCDDPDVSEFWKFFQRNFTAWGLKRLIATHYEPDAANCSYMIEMNPGDAWDGTPVRKLIQGNGDFRSAACTELLEQADIIVTNPPFSLFREYMALLIRYQKMFLVMGNKNAFTYREIFPLVRDNRIWPGVTSINGGRWMIVPPHVASDKARLDTQGRRVLNIAGVCWFTNMDHWKRHVPLELTRVYHGHEQEYPSYDNYAAIEVGRVQDIPGDYDGVMGVPITFLDKYCPEQFEIIGATESEGRGFSAGLWDETSGVSQPLIHGQRRYKRLFIKRRT